MVATLIPIRNVNYSEIDNWGDLVHFFSDSETALIRYAKEFFRKIEHDPDVIERRKQTIDFISSNDELKELLLGRQVPVPEQDENPDWFRRFEILAREYISATKEFKSVIGYSEGCVARTYNDFFDESIGLLRPLAEVSPLELYIEADTTSSRRYIIEGKEIEFNPFLNGIYQRAVLTTYTPYSFKDLRTDTPHKLTLSIDSRSDCVLITGEMDYNNRTLICNTTLNAGQEFFPWFAQMKYDSLDDIDTIERRLNDFKNAWLQMKAFAMLCDVQKNTAIKKAVYGSLDN